LKYDIKGGDTIIQFKLKLILILFFIWITILSTAYTILFFLTTYDIILDSFISWGFVITVIILLIISDIVIYFHSDKCYSCF
jgi:hypothetical protein